MRLPHFFCALFYGTVLSVLLPLDSVCAGPTTAPSRSAFAAGQTANAGQVIQVGNYVVIGWNDLGMHCISPRFADMAILPPFNTLKAIVIRKGAEPHVTTSNLTITYSLDNNTTVVGKSDFWTYAPALFGANLPVGIGLTGNGLSGKMKVVGDHFEAVGIPALPFNDQMVWNPYQHATLKLSGATATGETSVVIPVSDEMNCQKCHQPRRSPTIVRPFLGRGIQPVKPLEPLARTVEQSILALHDKLEGTSLFAHRPVLCASCHSDNALGTPGTPGVPSLSYAMHVKHSTLANMPTCYDCHPGARTQCNRSAIPQMGPVNNDPGCERCHGTLPQMATALKLGRRPWLDEPTCAQCHGARYSTGTTLYREAKGHGGVYCVACHNSPHSWLPSKRDDDNAQVLGLQGNNHALGYNACNVCHTDGRTGTVPPHEDD